MDDKDLLAVVVSALVDHPDDVKITRAVDEMGVLLTLDLHPEDMGKVIGREGNTAKAIRTLLRVVGMKHGARVNLKIMEPAGSTHVQRSSGSSVVREQRGPAPEMKSIDEALSDIG